MLLLLVTVLLGPAETLSGKYPRHCPEYLDLFPARKTALPDPLPPDVDTLCRLAEAGHPVYEALGEALLGAGEPALAFRAFDRAEGLAATDAERERIRKRKAACEYVPPGVIKAERDAAQRWVDQLRAFERERIRAGGDPRDLREFYERFGRPEERMGSVMRIRRASFLLRLATILAGVVAIVGGLVFLSKRRSA